MDTKEIYHHATEKFKNHIATYCDFGDVATLTWAKSERREYGMRYVFDKVAHTMTITGDLGYAVVCPTCKVDLEHCAEAFRNSVDYFAEKIKASSDLYVYDEDDAIAELRERLLRDDLSSREKTKREALIMNIMESYDEGQPGVRPLDDETESNLAFIDRDAWEWLGTIGRRYHLRVYLWMYGLQMAWKQVKNKNNPELHVVLGISTKHISKETQDYLDVCADGGSSDTVYIKEDCCDKYGWWVACFEEPESGTPEDLRRCIEFAQKHGANWLMLDWNATVYAELPDMTQHDEPAFIQATFKSAWDGGKVVQVPCKVNLETRQITLEETFSTEGLTAFEGEFVVFDGVAHQVCPHKPDTEECVKELHRMDAYWRE